MFKTECEAVKPVVLTSDHMLESKCLKRLLKEWVVNLNKEKVKQSNLTLKPIQSLASLGKSDKLSLTKMMKHEIKKEVKKRRGGILVNGSINERVLRNLD